MADDMFGTSHTVIAGRARIGDAVISFTDLEGNDYEIPAMNTQIQYSEEVKPQPLPGGEVFLTAQQPMGQIQIGALLHDDYLELLDLYGSMDNLVQEDPDSAGDMIINKMTINIDSGIYVEETSDTEAGNMITDTAIDATGVKLTNFGMKLDIQNVLLQTNVQMFALNIDKPTEVTEE